LAYLQLLRIPNVFTAIADVVMGFLITRAHYGPMLSFVVLMLTSCCLYLAGMVLNDVWDVEQDRQERPHRPIPSQRVSLRVALVLGFALLLAGMGLGLVASLVAQTIRPGVIALALALCIVLYDGGLKRSFFGPIVMGCCRLLNVLLGMSLAVDAAGELRAWTAGEWVVAIGVGVYIVGVTWFARTEARESSRVQLTAALAVLVGGLGLVASLPEWVPLETSASRWYAVWGVLALVVGQACIAAVRAPSPRHVQLAVKRCLMSLILIDAAVCFGVRGPIWAGVILLLLIPQWLLGKYVYST
jgi:4-hydroxybenzoate polyprenyltransferase